MFTDVCRDCLSGGLINELKKKSKLYHNSTLFLVILSDDFSTTDMANFKEITKIDIPILKAEGELKKKWNALKKEYGIFQLNNIVFLMNRNGKILNVMERNLWQEYFINVTSLIETNQKNSS